MNVTKMGAICGNIAHSDEQRNLIWLNGGLTIDKHSRIDEIYEFDHYTTDDVPEMPGNWTLIDGDSHRACWGSSDPKGRVIELSLHQKNLFRDYIDIYKKIRKGIMAV